MVRFWIAEVYLGHQELHDEIHTGRPPLDDLDAKIRAIFNKSPFESARSIIETLRVVHSTCYCLYMTLLVSDRSIWVGCRIC
jgi:hypothetical protein